MGDNHLQQPHAEIQPHLRPFFQSAHHSELANGVDTSTAPDEEEYTIRCICGFSHDDGNTVFCDECETWQHIDCYYFPDRSVPEIHQCVECHPRIDVDPYAAGQRQSARLQDEVIAREPKGKRPKGHKKTKTKDLSHLQLNGVSSSTQDNGTDRNSGSPRDHQPPPAKRTKTSHKPSNSISNTLAAIQRPPSSSGIPNSTPPKRPLTELPSDYFSQDFIRVHQENNDFTTVNANLHGSIDFTNQLSTWLDDEEEFKAVTGGWTHSQVFQQAPPLEELEVPIQKRINTDTSVTFHGSHPVWPYLTVEKDLVKGQLVAELRGLLGHRDEYKVDAENRWERLKHPDHFVFFHPYLPIYIDCRSEGTNLRYVRRSCRPNLEMKTFITDERDIRFCFTAKDDIPSGTEITIAWDINHDSTLQACLQHSTRAQEKDYVSKWMETILSHFGGCACELPPPFCIMEHWDRRLAHTAVAIPETNPQTAKNNKKRKQSRKSPQTTGRASNSHAGSDVNENDDDEDDDTHSSSRSSKASRDGTPTNPQSLREQKKLEQAMRRIEKQENEGSKRKKRASGTSITTPGTKNSRSGATPTNSNSPMPGGRFRNNNKVNGNVSSGANPSPAALSPSATNSPGNQLRPRDLPNGIHPTTTRPVYVDRSTQTEQESELLKSAPSSPIERKPYMSLSKRLLKRSYLRHVQQPKGDCIASVVKTQFPPSTSPLAAEAPSQTNSAHAETFTRTTNAQDVEMKDAEEQGRDAEMTDATLSIENPVTSPLVPEKKESSPTLQESEEQRLKTSNLLVKPPTPPWDHGDSTEHSANKEHRSHTKGAGLHIDMPPPSFPLSAGGVANMGSSPSTLSAPILQSPLVTSPPLATSTSTPGGTSITQPSPVKKRMSLSDYIKKRNQTPVSEKSQSLSLQTDGADAAVGESVSSPIKADVTPANQSASPPLEQVKSDET